MVRDKRNENMLFSGDKRLIPKHTKDLFANTENRNILLHFLSSLVLPPLELGYFLLPAQNCFAFRNLRPLQRIKHTKDTKIAIAQIGG